MFKVLCWVGGRSQLTLSLILLCISSFSNSNTLTTKDFSSLPDVGSMKLSPDGLRLAYLARVDVPGAQGMVVSVQNISTGNKRVVLYSDNKKFTINWLSWANNEKIFVSASFPEVRRNGTPSVESRLLIVDSKTGKFKNGLSRSVSRNFRYLPQFQDRIIDYLRSDPDHYLLQISGHGGNEPTVYKVNSSSRKMKLVRNRKRDVTRWVVDAQHNVRLGVLVDGKSYKIIHTNPGEKKQKTLWEFEAFGRDQVWPLGFGNDPYELYVTALHDGRDAIFKVNLKDEGLPMELVYSNKKYDVGGSLFYSEKTGDVVGLKVSDGAGYVFWTESYKALLDGVNKGLPDTHNRLLSFSKDERRYLVLSKSDVNPGTYYLGDRDKKTLDPIGYSYSKIFPDYLSPREQIEYKARDGLSIEAYLTLPKRAESHENLPTIIFPHGGPISSFEGGFDYWTQFFANSGYAVLQMNFRGSEGYGYDFMAAGLKSWGLAMQDDVEDGVRWMIQQGYSDPKNICIVGAGYGGYAALMGAVKSKGLYKCAVSFAGISDVGRMVKFKRRYTNYDIVKARIGSDMGELKKRSPVYHADEIDIPVLLIHGTKDRVVNYVQSRLMNEKLMRANKDVRYVELKDGGHYLGNSERRNSVFEELDSFLEIHLK